MAGVLAVAEMQLLKRQVCRWLQVCGLLLVFSDQFHGNIPETSGMSNLEGNPRDCARQIKQVTDVVPR